MEAMQVTGPELDQEQPQRKKRVLILDLLQGREEGQYAGRSAPKRARGNGLVSYSHGSMPSRAFQRRCASSTHWISHLDVHTKMKGHQGCVNTIIWNSTGDLLVSGSDDTQVMIWDMNRCSLQHSYMSGHTANIFCARFLPFTGDKQIISCAGDHEIRWAADIQDTNSIRPFYCHDSRVKKLCTLPGSPFVFYSCSEDATVRRFDLREPHDCEDSTADHCRKNILVDLRQGDHCYVSTYRQGIGLNSISINERDENYFVTGGNDPIVRIYDHRMIGSTKLGRGVGVEGCVHRFRPTPNLQEEEKTSESESEGEIPRTNRWIRRGMRRGGRSLEHITGVCYSKDGRDILATYGGDYVYRINVEECGMFATAATYGVNERYTQAYVLPPPNLVHIASAENEEGTEEDKKDDSDEREDMIWESVEDRAEKLENKEESKGEEEEEEEEEEQSEYEDESASSMEGLPEKALNPEVHISGVYEQKYVGHLNVQTIKEINFLGPSGEFVASGSDDGRIFIWEKEGGRLVQILDADTHVVNCIRGHPLGLPVIASSGIDNDVKVWSATREEESELIKDKEKITKKNAKQLKEGPIPLPLGMMILEMLQNHRGDEDDSEDTVQCVQQ